MPYISPGISARKINSGPYLQPRDEQAYMDWRYYEAYRNDTMSWRISRVKMIMLATGNSQWSAREKDVLEAREEVDVLLNRVRPALRTAIAIQLRGKPQGIVYGSGINSIDGLLQKFCDYHWEKDNGIYLAEKNVTRQNREGLGFYHLYKDMSKDYGRGELCFGHLSFNNVFVDKGVGGTWDWSDAPRFIVSRLERPDVFYRNHPNIRPDASLNVINDEPQYNAAFFEDIGTQYGKPLSVSNALSGYNDGDYIRPLDVYEKMITNVHVIKQRLTGKILRVITENNPITEQEKRLMVRDVSQIDQGLFAETGLNPQYAEFFLMDESDAPVQRIQYHRSVSGKLTLENSYEVLPIDEYPIVPVVDEDLDNCMPNGETDYMYPTNKILNSMIALIMLNAAGSTTKKTLIDFDRAGLSSNAKDFAERWAAPNALEDMKWDPTIGDFPIKELYPQEVNQSLYNIVNMLFGDIQAASQITPLRSGSTEDAPETFRALAQLGQWSDDNTIQRRNRHELAIERLFRLMLGWAPYHYTFHKFFTTVNQDNGSNEVYEINSPKFDETSKTWGIVNSINGLKADYKIKLGSTMESDNLFESQLLVQLLNGNPAIQKHIIQRMPTFKPSEKQEILRDMDAVAQLSGQNKQLQDQMRVLMGELNRQRQHADALSKQLSLLKFEKRVIKKDTQRVKPNEGNRNV